MPPTVIFFTNKVVANLQYYKRVTDETVKGNFHCQNSVCIYFHTAWAVYSSHSDMFFNKILLIQLPQDWTDAELLNIAD